VLTPVGIAGGNPTADDLLTRASALYCADYSVGDALALRDVLPQCSFAIASERVLPGRFLSMDASVTFVALFSLTRLETRTKESNLYASMRFFL
jgi:hypothetical protein